MNKRDLPNPKIKDAAKRFQSYYPWGRIELVIEVDQYEIKLYRNKEDRIPAKETRNRVDSEEGWIPVGMNIWNLTDEFLDPTGDVK